jgi:hypothetical protein
MPLPSLAEAHELSMLLFKSKPAGDTEKKQSSNFLPGRNVRFGEAGRRRGVALIHPSTAENVAGIPV